MYASAASHIVKGQQDYNTVHALNTANAALFQSNNAFNIDAHLVGDANRSRVEAFIKEGFDKSYGAQVSITMPTLLAVKRGAYKAALGIRTAQESLFIEQYLSAPVEDYLSAAHKSNVNRDKIVEIGHLYSNHNRFALPLLLTTGVSLFNNQYQHIVFCATSHVRKLIETAGINITELADADKTKLKPCANSWGSYYDTQPKVVAISTSEIMHAIAAKPKYQQMFTSLTSRIHAVSRKIAGQQK